MGRVPQKTGPAVVRSLGTGSPEIAAEIRELLKRLKRYGNFAALELVTDRHVTAFDLYAADKQGQLNTFVNKTLAALAAAGEPDLDELLAAWPLSGGKKRYVTQCRRLIPRGERFPASLFTRARISVFLHGLDVSEPTKNRYRAALMQFGKFLIEREVLEHNPVERVKAFKENAPRVVHYDDATARAVIDALDFPYRALEALMCGTGLEWSAAVRVRPSDYNSAAKSLVARGTKTRHRTREVRFMEEWCWRIFDAHAAQHVGNLPYFADLKPRAALAAHRAALAAVRADDSTLHDWRHTFAVRERRKGTDPQVIKQQLGHAANSTLVERVYGAYTPTDTDYTRHIVSGPRKTANGSATRRGNL
jgi:integrase